MSLRITRPTSVYTSSHTHKTQETIGNVTGSEAWKSSGAQDKEHAIGDMKAASANRDPSTQGMGGLEEKAGNLVGCEGMQKEGAESKKE
ncbi:hypothetical protein IAQ61_006296 [Plenodomus lingam]|uniref:uncharacterized protein n=1 Tax=Leptosphaeria maculans TaxID=5022 RepID=UPI003326C927|nr:hypothetical protein IAQ61_006296 [Plenodomus lingam]